MNTTFEKLVELIGMNPGIKLGSNTCSDSIFRLRFHVQDAHTRHLMHFISEASNTLLTISSIGHPAELGAEMNPDDLITYEFRSKRDGDTTDQVCWLGAHLTWAMYKMEAIDKAQEQEYCKIFEAVSKKA